MANDQFEGVDLNDPAARLRAVRAAIAAEANKLARTNANGGALPYAQQSDEYRRAVSEEAHVAVHGTGHRPGDRSENPERTIRQGSRDLTGRG